MTAPLKHWYLIAYDVRHPKRLHRVQRYLSRQALALQESVFLLQVDAGQLRDCEQRLRQLADPREDDLRLYAIPGPAALWAAGRQTKAAAGLFGGQAGPPEGGRLRRWFQGLFGREAA